MIPPVTGRNIYLAADNGFNAGTFALAKELDSSEHIAMVCYSYIGHVKALCLFNKVFNGDCPVKKAELRMHVQVYK
jgi:hypothetical protein